MNIFLTGGTGFIGRHLLLELASQHHIYVLVRHTSRLHAILNQLSTKQKLNIEPLIGDLTQPRLGLDESSYKKLLTSDVIIHAGGPMNIELNYIEAEQTFLYSAKTLIELATEIHNIKGLQHFIHVVGFMSPFNEQNKLLDMDYLFDKEPPYEKMKFLADSYIRKNLHTMNIPLSTVNPSVIVGDSFSGKTEQLGGLSILIDAVRRNLMAVVPGGDYYWLPMVHVDHVASFITQLVEIPQVTNNTYYLLDAKHTSPSMRKLIELIAKELHVALPVASIPLPVMKLILGLGASKLLGLPKESMNFLVKSDFPIDTKLEIEQRSKMKFSFQPSTLPFIVSDLDYRISHSNTSFLDHFSQRRRADLITLERDNPGIPVIFLHGTFSSADSLLPLSHYLNNYYTLFVDLPGFGRTPYYHNRSVIDGYINSVVAMIKQLQTPVILIGHSFGGLIAARIMQSHPSLILKLLLLQPVLHPIASKYKNQKLTKLVLRKISTKALHKQLLNSKNFIKDSKHLERYVNNVVLDLKSPRIRTTNAIVMSSLTQQESINLNPTIWDKSKVKILWGSKDDAHVIPQSFEHLDITRIPFGHQFPIENPEQTATWISKVINIPN